MIDGLFSGLVGGLFGPAIAQWLSRFKYWVVFSVAMLSTQVVSVVFLLKKLGFEKTVAAFANGIDSLFYSVPMGIGVLAVFFAFVGSLSAPTEGGKNSMDDQG